MFIPKSQIYRKPASPSFNQRGQTLIEYLIIVALVGVGSIALMRAVSQNINARFAEVVSGLGGQVASAPKADNVTKTMFRNKNMRDFVRGANNTKSGRGTAGDNSSENRADDSENN